MVRKSAAALSSGFLSSVCDLTCTAAYFSAQNLYKLLCDVEVQQRCSTPQSQNDSAWGYLHARSVSTSCKHTSNADDHQVALITAHDRSSTLQLNSRQARASAAKIASRSVHVTMERSCRWSKFDWSRGSTAPGLTCGHASPFLGGCATSLQTAPRHYCSLPLASERSSSCSNQPNPRMQHQTICKSTVTTAAAQPAAQAAVHAATSPRRWQSAHSMPIDSSILHPQPKLSRLQDLKSKLQSESKMNIKLDEWSTVPMPAQQEPVADNENQLDWRTLLQQVREEQQQVTGTEMLTDMYRRKHTYLRISLTERCNLRCQYCMPAEGVELTPSKQLLTVDEIHRLASTFANAGVTKVRLTGGEPTVRKDIVDITRMLAQMPGIKTVGITSNGIVLGRMLPQLKEAGLNALNISLDTLDPHKFEVLTRRDGHKKVLQSIQTALELGFDPVKMNVVVMRGVNDVEIPAFTELTRSQPINVRFIEYMPFDGNVWSDRKMVGYKEMMERVTDAFPQGLERLDDPYGEVAKNFRVSGFMGSVSFITSMTHHFCGECNRLRLLADGSLKVCLHGASEVSLRDAMRDGATDEELKCIISAAVDRKKAAHAGMLELAKGKNRAMIRIGG